MYCYILYKPFCIFCGTVVYVVEMTMDNYENSSCARIGKLLLLALLAGGAEAGAHATPQSITWFYANSLSSGAAFLESVGLVEVEGLIQKEKCRIFHVDDSDSAFLGVCITRAAPVCTTPASGDSEAVTFTLVVENRAAVDAMHASLLPLNESTLILTEASGSAEWGAYGFNFFDRNTTHGLGCYRMEVQSFDDAAWPAKTTLLDMQLRNRLRQAGVELEAAVQKSGPTPCPCDDFCSGRCFAASCQVCPPSVWDDDKSSCLSAGPLGQGLLCAPENDHAPCCSPNGTACQLVGRQWCDCSKFPSQPPLFPVLRDRSWTKAGGCKDISND